MKEDISKFPMKIINIKKDTKETVKKSCLCKAGRFSYGESPRTPPLEGTSLHRRNISVERPWGILSLFTTCLPLWVKSSHQSRCHTSPTQELIACILRRQSSPIYGVLDRTEPERKKKKSAGEEWALRKPEINRITQERKALEQHPPPPTPEELNISNC